MNDTSMQNIKVGHRAKIQSKFVRTGNKACEKNKHFLYLKIFLGDLLDILHAGIIYDGTLKKMVFRGKL